ncbi:MAG: hypothetical protein JOZ13_05260 [Alphaproteobacteria bacterium]|nr:hypothetical protein [Alphaproteobacteria bacterium]
MSRPKTFSKKVDELRKLFQEMDALVAQTERAISRMKSGPEKNEARARFEAAIRPFYAPAPAPTRRRKLPHPQDVTLLKEQANRCRMAGQTVLQNKALAEASRLQKLVDAAKSGPK